jgi:Domain of unknown function (DUF4193)
MSDDEFEDEPELDEEELDEDALEEDFDEELVGDDLEDDDEIEAVVEDEAVLVVPLVGAVVEEVEPGARTDVEEEEEDDVVDLDEELHPDDVEEALDVVLRERTVAAGLEGEDDEDEPDEPGEGGTKIVPRRENEFLCRSCFLVLPRHQLADESRMICRDCA